MKFLLSTLFLIFCFSAFTQNNSKPIKFNSNEYSFYKKNQSSKMEVGKTEKGYTLILLDLPNRRVRIYPDTEDFLEYSILGVGKTESKDGSDDTPFSCLDSHSNKCNIVMSFIDKKPAFFFVDYSTQGVVYTLYND